MCGDREGTPVLPGAWLERPRTASSSGSHGSLSSAPRLAGDGAGAVNIGKSLAAAHFLCCPD